MRLTAHTWLCTERAWPPVNHPFTSGCTNTLADQFPVRSVRSPFPYYTLLRLSVIVSQGWGSRVDKVSRGQHSGDKIPLTSATAYLPPDLSAAVSQLFTALRNCPYTLRSGCCSLLGPSLHTQATNTSLTHPRCSRAPQ